MEYLLDIHIVLLTLTNDQRLNALVKEMMEDPENTFITVLFQCGKLPLNMLLTKKCQ